MKNIKYLLLILYVIALIIPWSFVFGIQDEDLRNSIGIFQRTAALILLTPIIVVIIYKAFRLKTLKQLINDGTNKIDTKKEQQFGPPWGLVIFFMGWIPVGVINIFSLILYGIDGLQEVAGSGLAVFMVWLLYKTPFYTFTKNSLQIESFLFHFFHINRKKMIKYEDIVSAKISRIKGTSYAMYALFITTKDEKKKRYPLVSDDITAKIYLCFKEKIGDRIKSSLIAFTPP
ncbi:MAG: hypothetical protein WA063_04230 [Minisyncoccia bacterium]